MDALAVYADAAAFAEVWASEDPVEINRRAPVERDYEVIVNNCNEIFDRCERERGISQKEASDTGLGRWHRLAGYDFVSEGLANELRELMDQRRVFQHSYADADRRRGTEVYEDIDEFLEVVRKLVDALDRWTEELWPQVGPPPSPP